MDIFEIGIGGAHRFNSEIFKDNNFDHFGYNSGVFPFLGDFSNSINANLLFGHRFSGREKNFDVFIKYVYQSTAEDDGEILDVNDLDPDQLGWTRQVKHTGYTRQHDVGLVFRLSSWIFPYDFMRHENLYVDLGASVSTIVYDYTSSVRDVYRVSRDGIIVTPNKQFDEPQSFEKVRSGVSFNFGLGYLFDIGETVAITPRIDVGLGRIMGVKGSGAKIVHEGPITNSIAFSIGIVKEFNSLL
ncbi:MAG: hypothetical protein Q8O14_14245 [bacterium]|nr:hypothetical protein [bacterium]